MTKTKKEQSSLTLSKIRNIKRIIRENWTRGEYFRNQYGNPREEYRPGYKCCLVGACWAVNVDEYDLQKLLSAYLNRPDSPHLITFNDNSGKRKVLEFLDWSEKQIAKAQTPLRLKTKE